MSEYTLKDYNELAYEFAIRNPEVIKLLTSELTRDTATNLLTYGIDITDEEYFSDGTIVKIYTLKHLYLKYDHLPFTEDILGSKRIVNPNSLSFWYNPEPIESEIESIHELFSKQGGRLQYIMSKNAFEHYDQYIESGKNMTLVANYKNNKKQIKKDISFVEEWINPKQYLLLIPEYYNLQKRSLEKYKREILNT